MICWKLHISRRTILDVPSCCQVCALAYVFVVCESKQQGQTNKPLQHIPTQSASFEKGFTMVSASWLRFSENKELKHLVLFILMLLACVLMLLFMSLLLVCSWKALYAQARQKSSLQWFIWPSATRRGVRHHVHTESFCILHTSSFRESSRVFCISACGEVGLVFRGLTSSLSVTVVLRNPMETKSALTGSCDRDALQNTFPLWTWHTQATHSHEPGWEEDITARCRRTRSTDLDPFQAHKRQTQHIYPQSSPASRGFLVCRAVSQWLAWDRHTPCHPKGEGTLPTIEQAPLITAELKRGYSTKAAHPLLHPISAHSWRLHVREKKQNHRFE